MKYSKKRSRYEASNVTFDDNAIEAYSYKWWCFVKVINGLVVFNNYNYSISTRNHQAKVRKLMRESFINIDLEISSPRSLGDSIEDHMVPLAKIMEAEAIYKKARKEHTKARALGNLQSMLQQNINLGFLKAAKTQRMAISCINS